jgi:hypothetical protein
MIREELLSPVASLEDDNTEAAAAASSDDVNVGKGRGRGMRGNRYGLLIGSHLCGRLSSQAIALFQAIPQVAGVVLSPCCWPRRRDFNSDEDLMELAVLLWAKAVSSDTYATWVLHLWGLLSGQRAMPLLTPPEGEATTGLWTVSTAPQTPAQHARCA